MNANTQNDNESGPDLKSLLGEQAGETTAGLAVDEIRRGPGSASSQTVLKLDKWGVRRGEDLSGEWKESELGEVDPIVAADAHGALFEPEPQVSDNPADKARAAYWRQLMETPEFGGLHAQTELDPDMSALAAKSICDEYAKYVAEQPDPQDGKPGPGSEGESVADEMARIRSTCKALAGAREDLDTANDAMEGLGLGGNGNPGGQVDRKALAKAFQKVRNNDLLRKVMQLAGRMRARCRSLQRQKLSAKHGEITGIELGGDLDRLVDEETLALAGAFGEAQQDLAEMNLLQSRSLCYRQKLNTPVQAGPIVVSVDESGSMGGDKIIAAKALALTLAWLAGQQNRWFALVGFSGSSGDEVELNAVCFPPGHRDPEKLIAWVEHFFSGGTDFDCPCKAVPEVLWPQWVAQGLKRGKTDHIIISDAIVEMTDERVEAYNRWSQAEQVKNYGILIGGDDPGYLGKVTDRCWVLPELSLETAAVEEVLSL